MKEPKALSVIVILITVLQTPNIINFNKVVLHSRCWNPGGLQSARQLHR